MKWLRYWWHRLMRDAHWRVRDANGKEVLTAGYAGYTHERASRIAARIGDGAYIVYVPPRKKPRPRVREVWHTETDDTLDAVARMGRDE